MQIVEYCKSSREAFEANKMAFIIFLAFSLLLQGAFGELVCEELPSGICAFSIASSGKRCTLETSAFDDENSLFQCKTSEVLVNGMREHIETDECIRACGVDRNAIGISSDRLLEPQFTAKLCSDGCSNNCPNIVDLYYNLALAEGVFLPEMCNAQKVNARRAMSQLLSSGYAATTAAAAGPVSSGAYSPTSAPGRILAEFYAPAPATSEYYYSGYEAWAPTPL